MGLQFYTFDIVNTLSFLTIVGQVIAVIVLLICFFQKSALHQSVTRNALVLMFIVALTAVSGSLFFSEIATWVPCKDCWFQRIFMYPQVILLLTALVKRDRTIAPYILAMCLIGMVISNSEQVEAALHPVPKENGVNALLKPCDVSGVSCAATQIQFAFGYITIPVMALTAFVLNAIGCVCLLRSTSERSSD